jgi:predicted Zn-dependent peptidase
MPLRRETAAANALLPMVLQRGCREYADMTALNRRLKELYGARLDGGVAKRGEVQTVTLYCEILSDHYALEGENLSEQGSGLLKSVIFDPILENGCFRADDVEIEKRNLADIIDSQLNDKRYYASQRLKEEMCKDEAYGVYEFGTREDALNLTLKQLYDAWLAMMASARVEIFFVGDGDAAACKTMFSGAFSALIRKKTADCSTQVIKDVKEVRTFTEHLPVSQAKLGLGFRAGTAAPEADIAAMQLACTVLGGSPHSLLFLNVREKLSLCYYCFSRFERQKGLVFIESGIEEANAESAKAEILRQLGELKAGNFTDEDLSYAALSLENSYKELNDSLFGIAGWYLGQAIAGRMRTPAEAAQEVAVLQKESVVKAAQKITLDTVYLLAGEKED